MRAKIRHNTPAEEAAIQRGIAADPDSPELGDEFFANARPAREMMPPEVYNELVETSRRRRGPGRKPPKAQVTLRLDQDVIDGLRASGPGWQARANEALRRIIPQPKPATNASYVPKRSVYEEMKQARQLAENNPDTQRGTVQVYANVTHPEPDPERDVVTYAVVTVREDDAPSYLRGPWPTKRS